MIARSLLVADGNPDSLDYDRDTRIIVENYFPQEKEEIQAIFR